MKRFLTLTLLTLAAPSQASLVHLEPADVQDFVALTFTVTTNPAPNYWYRDFRDNSVTFIAQQNTAWMSRDLFPAMELFVGADNGHSGSMRLFIRPLPSESAEAALAIEIGEPITWTGAAGTMPGYVITITSSQGSRSFPRPLSGAVPEPSSLALVLAALGTWFVKK